MNVVDSSVWLEYFADGPNAKHFAAVIEKPDALLVPSCARPGAAERLKTSAGVPRAGSASVKRSAVTRCRAGERLPAAAIPPAARIDVLVESALLTSPAG